MKVETLYNDLRVATKENAGLPDYYYDLSIDQKIFVDDFYEVIAVPPHPKEEVEEVRELIEELSEATEALLQRYAGR